MKVLVACEESQAVCEAFRRNGHIAYSCDIIEPSGGHPEWHILGDCRPYLNGPCVFETMDGQIHAIVTSWDMIIAFPPCTYLSNVGAMHMRIKGKINQERYEKAMEARKFFLEILNADCDKICIENPTPMSLVNLPKYTQAIQPWQFGHPFKKRTCLWLKGLKPLRPTDVITEGIRPWVSNSDYYSDGKPRKLKGAVRDKKLRAKTFLGIAQAMADQWGGKL